MPINVCCNCNFFNKGCKFENYLTIGKFLTNFYSNISVDKTCFQYFGLNVSSHGFTFTFRMSEFYFYCFYNFCIYCYWDLHFISDHDLVSNFANFGSLNCDERVLKLAYPLIKIHFVYCTQKFFYFMKNISIL
jgi:hypothetical protein